MSIFERLSAWFVLFFLLLSLLFAFFFINREIHAAAFTIGERVQVSADSLNVYSKAGTSYSVRGVQPMGALGTVVGGPKSANGYTWWNINYDAGVDGWSTENNLKSVPSSFTSVIYEAEQLALVNYTVDSSLIKIKTGYTTGSATRNFTGATGTYNMQVYVSLENDGQSTLAVYKGSTLLKTYKYPLGSNGMIAGFSVGNVSLTGGDTILLVGNIDAGALARVDKIVFTSVSNSLTPPSSPTNLTGTAGNTTASLSWSASSGATSYTVKRSTTNGGPYTAVATGLTGTSHADTGLTNGTTYYYVVSAVNADGESANSAQASVTPFAMVVTTGTTPLGWWKLDGNASDSGSGGNTGTLTGSPTWVAGRSDQAMHLSSTANMTVSALNNASFPASGTLTFWIKTDNPMTTGNVNLFDGYASTRNHVFIRFTGVGKIQAVFQRSDGTYVTVFDLTGFPQTTWAHVAVVWNTATDRGQVYVNGALLSDKAINDATWTPNQQTVLFRDAALGTYDDIRLYNTALTASEVTEVYNY